MLGAAFGSFFFLFVSGVYTFNNKQWINKDIGLQLPECEEGRKSGVGNRLRVGTGGVGAWQVS